jgi:hypothetical protein
MLKVFPPSGTKAAMGTTLSESVESDAPSPTYVNEGLAVVGN